MVESLPARGVWIEMVERGGVVMYPSRSPQGECGLKFGKLHLFAIRRVVAPRKGSVD